jgi:hypothetical protein
MGAQAAFWLMESATAILEAIITYLYLESFFDKRPSKGKILGYLAFCAGLTALSLFLRIPAVLASYAGIGLFVLATLFYNANLASRLISVFFFEALVVCVEILCAISQVFLTGASMLDMWEYSPERIRYVALAKTLQLIGVGAASSIFKLARRKPGAGMGQVLPLLLCQAFSLIIAYGFFASSFQGELGFMAVASMIGLVCINVATLFHFVSIEKAMEYRIQKESAEARLELQRQHYLALEEQCREASRIWHDIDKHMKVARSLVSSGLAEEAKQHVDELGAQLQSMPRAEQTLANAVISALLEQESRKAKECNVQMACGIRAVGDMAAGTVDLCVVLGNVIDNAIEACSLLPEGAERKVDVSVSGKNGSVLIDVKNPFDPKAERAKPGRRGYGIQNVRRVVERRNGLYEAVEANGEHHVSILLP